MRYSTGEEPRVGDVVCSGLSEREVAAVGERTCEVAADSVRYTNREGWDYIETLSLISRAPEHRKDDSAKPDFTLIDSAVLLEVAEVFTHGGEKYGDDNWRKCTEPKRYIAAAERHINAWLRGEGADADSGKSHLAHAVCSLIMARGIENG